MNPEVLRERLVDVAALALQARDEVPMTQNYHASREMIRLVENMLEIVNDISSDLADDVGNSIADQAEEQSERDRGQLPYFTALPTDPELEAEHMRPEDFKS